MKKRCALEALKYIKDGMTVGLGGGSTISYLIQYIEEKKLNVKVVTPSYQTAALCLQHHLNIIPTWSVSCVDIAFDGCDEVDLKLNALKSGGAIHTKEKIIAAMAKDYVLLVDETKVFETLPFHHSVTIEIIPESMTYVKEQLNRLGAHVTMRTGSAKDGYTISDHGNFIMEAKFEKIEDIQKLNHDFTQIVGIVDTSLFVGQAAFALSADEKQVRVIR